MMLVDVPRCCSSSEEAMTVSSGSTVAASMASAAVSAAWEPASWGQGVVPARGEELVSYSSAAGPTGDDTGVVGTASCSSVIHDFDEEMPSWDEEMEPFDAERFVDRLVEDDPPSWRGGAAGGGAGKVWEAAKNSSGSTSANLFLWPSQQPLMDGYGVGNHQHQHHQHHQQSQDVPMVVPHDPILDALFTPCRVTPAEKSQPAVTFGLVRVTSGFGPAEAGAGSGAGGQGGKKSIMGFEPVPIYNIPPPAEVYSASLQVPMAPLRQPSGGRFGVGLYSSDSSSSSAPIIQSAKPYATYLIENSENVPGTFTCGATATTTTATDPLTGADAHSSQEYDDERHAFLLKQEAVVFVEPKYLNHRVLTPSQRAAAVDWLAGLHAAAPAASGGGAGEPLSVETLFLAVSLMDRFLLTADGARTAACDGGGEGPGPELKLAAAACVALASKYQDTQAASLWGLAVASISGNSPSSTPLHLGGVGGDGGGGGVGVGLGLGDNGGGGGDVFGVLGAGDGDVRAARKELVAMEMRVASALG